MVCDQWPLITDILNNGVEIICFITSKKSNVNCSKKNNASFQCEGKKMLICVRTFDIGISISNCIKAKKCHSINFIGSDGTFCCTSCWVITREKPMKKTLYTKTPWYCSIVVWLTYFILHSFGCKFDSVNGLWTMKVYAHCALEVKVQALYLSVWLTPDM